MRPFGFSCVTEVWKSELMPHPSSHPPSLLLGKWNNCIDFCKHCMTSFSWSMWRVIQKVKSVRDPHSGRNCAAVCHSWMWELDNKKGWVLKSWCFKLWCWRRFLRVPWKARKSNPSILKELSPDYSSEGLMLKLKFQNFGHLMQRADSFRKRPWCWERLKAGRQGDDRGWDG